MLCVFSHLYSHNIIKICQTESIKMYLKAQKLKWEKIKKIQLDSIDIFSS